MYESPGLSLATLTRGEKRCRPISKVSHPCAGGMKNNRGSFVAALLRMTALWVLDSQIETAFEFPGIENEGIGFFVCVISDCKGEAG